MRQCPNGHEVGGEAKFCPICGAEVIDNGTTYCAKCGNERKGTEKFCSQCGTPFGGSPMLGNNKTPKKSSKKGIVIAAVVCLLMLATGGAAWYFLQKDKYSLEGLAMAAVNYDGIEDFSDGLAVVLKGDKYGYIDKMGNEVIPCIYEGDAWTATFHEGLALVKQGNRTFFINKKGKEAFPFNYEGANAFHDGLALVWKEGKYGYIDKKGNEIIPLTDRYQGEDFSDGLAGVWKDEKYGYIDKKGNLVIPMQYDRDGYVPSFSDGLALLKKNDKFGYIDTKGNEIVSCKYIQAYGFSDGLALVYTENGGGYIDKEGNEVVPCNFDEAYAFSGGYAYVEKDGKSFFIDKSGKEAFAWNLEGYTIGSFYDGFAMVTKYIDNDPYEIQGLIDTNGKEVVPCVYTYVKNFSEGLAVVEKDGVYGFVDKKGNSTFDVQNEDVKRVVQAKIKQKEEERRKEEQRMEEERRRIEEENKPSNLFYKIAQGGDYVWEGRYFGLDFGSSEKTILYFYPSNKGGGRVTLLNVPKDESKRGYYAGLSGTGFYTVTADFLSFSIKVLPGAQKEINTDFNFEIKKDGNYITLIRLLDNRYKVNKAEYYQRRKERQDPLN